jgi:dephospho-CoA kinase
MVVVGLTGGIGSGKSTVSAALAARGVTVIDADAITRELQEPGQPVFDAMVERFGDAIVATDGSLDRAAMAAVAFSDREALADLNAIVHPAVAAEIARRLGAASTAGAEIVVLDVPLLLEGGRTDLAGVIVVDLDPELAVERLVAHRGFTEQDARARMARQLRREDRVARADFVVDNGGTREQLDDEIERCRRWLQELVAATAGQP